MKKALHLLLGMFALIAACEAEPRPEATDTLPEDVPEERDTMPGRPPEPVGGVTPVREPDPGSAEAALQVIHDYYAAIAGGDHERAYRYWSGGGEASGQSLEEFRSGYQQTESVTVEVGLPGRIDPAAGSRHIQVPAAVRARTTSGEAQCFRGAYTLRRAEVDGATEEQRRWRIASAELRTREASACDPGVAIGNTAADTVAAVLRAFGSHLASVSLLAPAEVLGREIRTQYASYVTPALLESWLERPSAAPGRTGSSPWPERIDVTDAEPLGGDRYRVRGDVVYLTSVEVTGGGSADRRPVQVEVVRQNGWRIARYEPG